MGTSVLSLRIDGELLDRLRHHAGIRGMNVQDYVLRTLVRTDFDERFKAAVEETQRFYEETEQPGRTARSSPGRHAAPAQVSPSAGIR